MPSTSGTSSSSMYTTTSFGSSLLDSSPSRQSPTRNVGRSHRGSLIRDPYDSPSRQIALEFNMRLSLSDRDFNEKLDQAAAERARRHSEQLARAAQEHERVARCAELEMQRIALEIEQRRKREEEAQRQELQRLRDERTREEAEAHQRALQAKQREEDIAREAAVNQRKIVEAEARLKAQKDQEAAIERQRVENDRQETARRAAEVAAASERAHLQTLQQQKQQQQQHHQVAPQPLNLSTQKSPEATLGRNANAEEIHAKYLKLHLRMKEFRNAFWNEHKKATSPLKQPVGDARRALRLRLGQINVERKDSVAAIKRLREECFDVALNIPGPMIDIRPYIISRPVPQLANDNEATYPAFLLYVWICFEKFLLKQFEKEAANEDGRVIQEAGLIAASLLGDQKYTWKGIPVTDIVLAKFHRACPPLFGVQGTMTTSEGRVRLGCMPTLTPDAYSQRLRGIGAGFAAMSLRTFAAKAPAVPMSEYWRAIVSICNTPPEHLWPGHIAILNGLIRDYYKKFVQFYGVQAKGVLRRATIDLPARAPQRCKDVVGTLSALPELWKKENFHLD